MKYDVAIVGGGPAGLATAIACRLRELSVLVVERSAPPIDKACGEGVLPVGLAGLRALGVQLEGAVIAGIRYVNEDGTSAVGTLPAPGGLGVRRLALSNALWARAQQVGVHVHHGALAWARAQTSGWRSGDTSARFLVGADGLHSSLRAQLGVVASQPSRRFGLRRHFAISPWNDLVEVHFADHVEAYVTPVGPDEVGIAFLWDTSTRDGSGGFETLLASFPALADRLRRAEPTSAARGAGPLEQVVSQVAGIDWALVGDAAGYVDAITGEGISLAVETARALAVDIAEQRGGAHYRSVHRAAFGRYARLTHALLAIAARPTLRRLVVRGLARSPVLFSKTLAFAVG